MSPIIIILLQFVLREPSDSKEALPHKAVLRSATTMCGAQSVMTSGVLLMHKWPVDNWDLVLQVKHKKI